MLLDPCWLFKANHCVKSCHVGHICTARDTSDKDSETETDRTRQTESDTLCSLTADHKYLIHKYSFKTRPRRNTLNVDLTFSKNSENKTDEWWNGLSR